MSLPFDAFTILCKFQYHCAFPNIEIKETYFFKTYSTLPHMYHRLSLIGLFFHDVTVFRKFFFSNCRYFISFAFCTNCSAEQAHHQYFHYRLTICLSIFAFAYQLHEIAFLVFLQGITDLFCIRVHMYIVRTIWDSHRDILTAYDCL